MSYDEKDFAKILQKEIKIKKNIAENLQMCRATKFVIITLASCCVIRGKAFQMITKILYICVGFRELSHLMRDLFHEEKKRTVVTS